MKKENQFCGNHQCKTNQTPLWRKGWKDQSGKSVMLCNACGLHWKKGHFCQFCKQIYKENDNDDVKNPWVGCDRCFRWVHKDCDSSNIDLKSGEPYLCTICKENGDAPLKLVDKGLKDVKKRKKSSGGQKKKKKEDWVSIDQLELPNPEDQQKEDLIIEELKLNKEELEQVFLKSFADRDGEFFKIGSLCAIAELEMKLLEAQCGLNVELVGEQS